VISKDSLSKKDIYNILTAKIFMLIDKGIHLKEKLAFLKERNNHKLSSHLQEKKMRINPTNLKSRKSKKARKIFLR